MNLNYVLRVWGLTIAVTPIMLLSYWMFQSNSGFDGNVVLFYMLMLVYSAVFSVPTLIVFLLVSFIWQREFVDLRKMKFYVILVGLVGMAVTFRLMFGKNGYSSYGKTSGWVFTIMYGLSIIIFGIFSPAREEVQLNEQEASL